MNGCQEMSLDEVTSSCWFFLFILASAKTPEKIHYNVIINDFFNAQS